MTKYESITFEVEKDLAKPTNYLPTKKLRNIFADIFTVSINRPVLPRRKTLKMFFSCLDTKIDHFFNERAKSLIQGLILAYKNHYPITITPDMIWLLIEQGFCRYVNKYHDKVREQFVSFNDKKELKVGRIMMTPEIATEDDWIKIIEEYVQNIEDNVGKDLIDNLQCDFSTNNQVAKIASKFTIMSAFKEYFTYRLLMYGCGISSFSLLGSIEDWEKIKSKLEYLTNKGQSI